MWWLIAIANVSEPSSVCCVEKSNIWDCLVDAIVSAHEGEIARNLNYTYEVQHGLLFTMNVSALIKALAFKFQAMMTSCLLLRKFSVFRRAQRKVYVARCGGRYPHWSESAWMLGPRPSTHHSCHSQSVWSLMWPQIWVCASFCRSLARQGCRIIWCLWRIQAWICPWINFGYCAVKFQSFNFRMDER